MSKLSNNTTALQSLLNAVNNLPSAGSGGGDVPSVELATPSISVDSGGKITASITQQAGKVAGGTKTATLQQTVQAAQTITPGTSDKTIASGRYLTGTQTIKGDANLKPENIVSGVSIFNVAGTAQTGGGGGGTVLENCSVELDIQVADAMAFYMYADPSGSLMTGSIYLNYANQTVEVLNGGMIVLYAPGNTSDDTQGFVTMWGSSGDYAVLAYRVTGDGYIWVQ